MSDNNSDDEALKEIDSEGESTEAVSGQPEVESDVQDKADSSDESHEEASADEEAAELAQNEPLDAEGEDKSDETIEEPDTQDSETEDELGEVKDWSSDDQLGEIPPEWRSFTVAGWTSFRDSHDYENVKQTSFSVILDTPEISTSLFGSTETQYFHLVIDNTNNSRDNDAVPVDTIAAYISIVSDERTTILPPWTVSLVCCALSIGLFAVPVILNKKYMSYGVSLVGKSTQIEKQLVPTMEQNQQSISTQEESTHLEDHEH